jgi:hypothetical protein
MSGYTEYPSESRTGRDNQVYEENLRQVSIDFLFLSISGSVVKKINLVFDSLTRFVVVLPLIPKQTKCSSFQAANMRMSGFLYVKEI